MRKKYFTYKLLLMLQLALVLFAAELYAQVPQGINYQGLARNSLGNVIANQNISLKVGVYAPSISGTLEWEEVHQLTTNQFGLFYCVLGQGTTTGQGAATNFSLVNWSLGNHFITVQLDENGGSSFVSIDTIQFWSVPYAMHSGTSSNLSAPMYLDQLLDVDTIGVFTNAVLKWNGALWIPAMDNDSDTALYAMNSSHSTAADTATYAFNLLSTVDTVLFANTSDSASYSINSGTANNAINSNYCDTAIYAFASGSAFTSWNLSGNSGTTPGTNFIGTTDNKDLVFKTNGSEKMRITAAGKVGIGTIAPAASLHVVGDNGIIAEGTFGSGTIAATGVGTRMMWYPKKAAFRVGGVSATQWDNANIGNYSLATGYNTRASGVYAAAFGSGTIASGAYSISACENSTASGTSSVAMGSSCLSSGAYSVTLSRGATASDTCSVAMGYHPTASGKFAFSLGYTTVASGAFSYALGYNANTNNKRGSFVYADPSSITVTNSSADNQFMVRASGGFIFYTNAAMTSGVSMAAGAGSWASVSDKNKKENFEKVSSALILDKIASLEISTWNYKSQAKTIRHIGPMAQDLYQLFSFGESDTTISTIDMDGISLSAIQELSKKTNELEIKAKEIEKLQQLVAELEAQKAILEKRITGIEEKIMKKAEFTSVNK